MRGIAFSLITSSMLSLLAAFAPANSASKATPQGQSQSGDTAPMSVRKLVPDGWKLESFAVGSLRSKSKSDLVMSIAKNPKGAFGDAEARRLLVAIPLKSGYKVIAQGDHALPLGMGPSGGDPSVSISKREIVTEVFGGSAYKFTENYYFALVNSKWLMTRYRVVGYQSTMENPASNTIDMNALTGQVIGTMSIQGQKDRRVDFKEVLSLNSEDSAKIPIEAPPLTISNPSSKCTASIRSTHTNNEITIEVTVVDNDVTKGDRVFITTQSGKPVRSKRRHQTKIAGGYKQTSTFELTEDQQFSGNSEDSNKFLNWIVNIEDVDATSPKKILLNTKFGRKSSHVSGGILMMTVGTRPSLQNINVQNGSFQEMPIDFPDHG